LRRGVQRHSGRRGDSRLSTHAFGVDEGTVGFD